MKWRKNKVGKRYVLKKAAYSGLAAGVVLTSVVPSMAMAVEDKPAKVVKEEDSFKSVEEGVKENDKVKAEGKSKEAKAKEDKAKATDEKAKKELKEGSKESEEVKDDSKDRNFDEEGKAEASENAPSIKGYELVGALERVVGKNNLYAPKGELHLKFDFEHLENIAELRLFENSKEIYHTRDTDRMKDIDLSRYLEDITLNRGGATDKAATYKLLWIDKNGNSESVTLGGDLKDKRLVYDANVSNVRLSVTGDTNYEVTYSSLDRGRPYTFVKGNPKINVELVDSADVRKVDVIVNGVAYPINKDGSGNYKGFVDFSKVAKNKDREYLVTVDTYMKNGDVQSVGKRLKISEGNPEFSFEAGTSDGVVVGKKKVVVGKSGSGYTIFLKIKEEDIPVELDRVELWKNGTKVKAASVTKNGDTWESDDLEVGEGTYQVRVKSDYGTELYDIGEVVVEEDKTAPTISELIKPDGSKDGKDWLVGRPDIPFEVKDESGLRSIEIKANGSTVYTKNITDGSKVVADVLRGQLYQADSDNKVKLEYILTDKFGNKVTKERTFYITNVRPSIVAALAETKGVKQARFGQDLFAQSDIMLKIRSVDADAMELRNSVTGAKATLTTLSSLVSMKGFDRIKVMNQLGISSEEYKLLKLYKELEGNFIVDDTRPTGVFKGLDLPSGVEWFASKPSGVSFVAVDDKALKAVRIKANGVRLVDEQVARAGVPYEVSKEYPIDLTNIQVSADGKIKLEVEVEDMFGVSKFEKEIKVDATGFETSNVRLQADKPFTSYDSGIYFKDAPSSYTYSNVTNLTGVRKYRIADAINSLAAREWIPLTDGKIAFDETEGQWVQFQDELGRMSDPIDIAKSLEKDGRVNPRAKHVYLDSKSANVKIEDTSKTRVVAGKTWVINDPKVKLAMEDDTHLLGYEVYFNGVKVVDRANEFAGKEESTSTFDLGEALRKYVDETDRSDVAVEIKVFDKAGNESRKTANYNIDLGKMESTVEGIGNGINDTKNKRFHVGIPYKIKLHNVVSSSGVAKVKFYNAKGNFIKEEAYEAGKEYEVPVGAVGYVLENQLGAESKKTELFGGSELLRDTNIPTIDVKVATDKYSADGKDWYAKIPDVTVTGNDIENLSEFRILTPRGDIYKREYDLEKTTGGIKVDFKDLEGYKGRKINYQGKEYGSDDPNAYNFVYIARDKIGQEKIAVGVYHVDSEAPKLRGTILSRATEFGNNLFYTGDFKAKIDVESLSGIKSATLGGEPIDLSKVFERTGEFENADLVVTNNLGVVTTQKLYDVLGISGKTALIDKKAPGVEYIVDGEGSYKDERGRTWFSDMKSFKLKLTDDKAIGNYVVKVNGVVMLTATLDGLTKEKVETIDFSNISTATDGTYTIETSIVDKAGRDYKSVQTVYIDHIKPDIKGIEVDGTKVTAYKDYGYYVKGSKLNVLGYNLQTPLTGAKLYKNGVEIEPKAGDYKEGTNAKYQYKDNLGRKSKEYTFAELVGLPKVDKNVFVYDTEAPKGNVRNVSSTKGDTEVKSYNAGNGVIWVSKMKYVGVDVSDDKGLHKVVVEVDGKEVYSRVVDGKLRHNDVVDIEKELGRGLDDGRHTVVYKVEDMAGHTYESSKTWYLDTKAPEIKGFDFVQEGYKEGSTLTTDFDKYGFFFQSGTDVRVRVEDAGESSGLDEVEVMLKSADGSKEEVKRAKVFNGVATVDVPVDFKGWVSAKVSDNIGNISELKGADGVITESKNWHVRTSRVDINLPDTGYRTLSGIPLYNGGVNLSGVFSQSVAGIRQIDWLVNGGNASKDWSQGSRDKNLTTSGTSSIFVNGDSQEHGIALNVMDNAGHVTEALARFAIDTTPPVINVSYDNNSSQGMYYANNRTATVTIIEKNFNPNDVRLRGVNVGLNWVSSGDVHTAYIPFTEDGTYNWGLEYTDMAGNAGQGYSSGEFVIDKTAPVVDVTWDNNDARNGNYYKNVRTATITVRERNFDASRFNVSGGSLSGWSSNGDIHTARVTFGDGEHKLTVSGADLAGNQSNTYDSGSFIVDTVSPELNIVGVSDGASYDGDVLPVITFSDKYINANSVRVTLRGQRNGTIEMKGSVVDGKFYVENLPKELKYDDFYTLTAHIEDMAGNTVEKSVSFYVNRFGAAFKFGSEDNVVKYYKQVTDDIEVMVTSVTPLDIDKFEYTVQLDGQVKEVKKPRVIESRDAQGNYVYRIIFDKDNFKENGVWGIAVKTVDKFGKVSDSGTVKMNFVVDNIKPNIVVIGAENNEFIESTSHKVTVKATDNVRLRDAKVYVNGVERKFDAEDIKRGSIDLQLEGSDEPYTIKVLASDLAGNEQEVTVENFYVSTNTFLKFKASVWFKVVLWLAGLIGLVVTFLVGRWLVLTTKRRREEEKALDSAVENEFED
jgi:hypothetical protein